MRIETTIRDREGVAELQSVLQHTPVDAVLRNCRFAECKTNGHDKFVGFGLVETVFTHFQCDQVFGAAWDGHPLRVCYSWRVYGPRRIVSNGIHTIAEKARRFEREFLGIPTDGAATIPLSRIHLIAANGGDPVREVHRSALDWLESKLADDYRPPHGCDPASQVFLSLTNKYRVSPSHGWLLDMPTPTPSINMPTLVELAASLTDGIGIPDFFLPEDTQEYPIKMQTPPPPPIKPTRLVNVSSLFASPRRRINPPN